MGRKGGMERVERMERTDGPWPEISIVLPIRTAWL